MRLTIISLLCLFFMSQNNTAFGQDVKWYTWEEVIELQKKEPRKVFVDVYTDWCGWCKKMDKTTFKHPEVAKYLNENFYSIKFNAEEKERIELNGETYNYVSNGRKGYHELAVDITKGKLTFPTLVFLNTKFERIQAIPGFKDLPTFEMIMTFFGGDFHKKKPWSVYQKTYKSFIIKQ